MKLKKRVAAGAKNASAAAVLCSMKRLLAEGKIDEKAVLVVRALCPDFSAVARDDAFGDGEAEAVASVPVPCAIQPGKALENLPAVGGGERGSS